jgi:hypothetical protein
MLKTILSLIIFLFLNCTFYRSGVFEGHIATFPDIKNWGPGDPYQNLLEVYISNPPGFFPDTNDREVTVSLYKNAYPNPINLLKEIYIMNRPNIDVVICWPVLDSVNVIFTDSAFYSLAHNSCLTIDSLEQKKLDEHTFLKIVYKKSGNIYRKMQTIEISKCIKKYNVKTKDIITFSK